MRSPTSHFIARTALAGILALDLLGLLSLLMDQLFALDPQQLWTLSGVLTVAAVPWLHRLSNDLAGTGQQASLVRSAGEKIP